MEINDFMEVLRDPRVERTLALALRDRAIRQAFQQMRRTETVDACVLALAGQYLLSEEHIRTIIYRKRRPG